MKDLAESEPDGRIVGGEDRGRAFRGEVADADQPARFENANDFAQVLVASRKERFALTRWEFVGRAVAAALLQKSERAIIHHEVVAEEFRRGPETFREQSPEPFAADLAAGAIESQDGAFRMLVGWTINGSADVKPVAHSGDLPERDAGLRHSERAWIHSKEEDALRIVSVTAQINRVSVPGIAQGVVNVRDRSCEGQLVNGIAQAAGGGDE